MKTLVEDVVDELRIIFQADGADLFLEGTTDDSVELRLIQGSEDCALCVMEPEFVEDLVADFLAARLGRTVQVTVRQEGL